MDGGIATYVIEGSFAVGILGFMYRVANDSNKKAETIFRRFDEYKEQTKAEFVSKEVCGIHTEQLVKDIQEIKTDIKILLRNGHNKNTK